MTIRTKAILVAALLAPLAAAQGGRASVYKVDFNIRDTGDAGAKTGRKYSLIVDERQKGVFKIGNRVPMATGGGAGNMQFTYVDVGVNIECFVAEGDSKINLRTDMDLSTAVIPEKNPTPNPTISQIKLNVETMLTPGKPSVVASFDDPVTSRKFDLEATVTKL
ncbi:MAG TPA: hypothetical protein VMH28_26895 [Candidatus Acidoferrales bacterium]|nr:hypothetical protein [Candidatus Acidoferrales bacterium]